ncbi:MAG: FAD-binding oxidoreductase, partial [Bacteroidota bacterium]
MDNSFLNQLATKLDGQLWIDTLRRSLYATDASVYRKLPVAVAYPKTIEDIKALVDFANTHKIGLIPRTAGTSLAGQCVGDGIVVDVSKHFTKIIELDKDNKTVRVQPGVVRDELNQYLKPFGLFFGPNTSTSNRCMIGGMVGNNSSGTTSIQYGVTRDKVVSLNCILSDGSEVTFSTISEETVEDKRVQDNLEGKIYDFVLEELSNSSTQERIQSEFPKPEIHRRNTGYAIDELLKSSIFGGDQTGLNLCNLLSGSEGTLGFTTEITLQLDDIPPRMAAMVCTHYANYAPLQEPHRPNNLPR